ncbi:MAG TPA: TonB-dependent receptor [Kofleriaceae bacterium]|nr:TonB-dependent receptor [Kofleriaceae bacterium]
MRVLPLLIVIAPTIAYADDEEVITVDGEAPPESASSVHLDRDDLDARPHDTPSDLFRSVPGLVVAQHAGGGKADQWFLRGFDADHGTDVAVLVDGVPVNLPSHGHGQGYADTHWLIPEMVQTIDVHEGPYDPRFGDFATAGAIEVSTLAEMHGVRTGVSSEATRRGVRGYAIAGGRGVVYAIDTGVTDGPFLHPQGHGELRQMLHVARGDVTLDATYYDASWSQSGQLPAAEVAAGRVDRFGSLDPSEGGATTRGSIALRWRRGAWSARVWGLGYGLDLFSDFTLYARDPQHGDEIEQRDERVVAGAEASYARPHRAFGRAAIVQTGVQLRGDRIRTSLWHAQQRMRLPDCVTIACNDDRDTIGDAGVYVDEWVAPADRLELHAGARADAVAWRVTDLDPRTAGTMDTTAGAASGVIANPKLALTWHATDDFDVFADAGGGFHSNDARAAAASSGRGALARALGGELGARVHSGSLRAAADLWYLHLESEQVWNGDEGGTEAQGPTRRIGADVDVAAQVTPWLAIDADLSIAHGTFAGGGAIPLAPRIYGSGGAIAHRGASFVSLHARGIGPRPADRDGMLTADGYCIVDAVAGTRAGAWELGVTATNLLNSEWREAQVAEISRVTPTAPLAEDIHFTPGAPLTIIASATYTMR